MRLATWNVNSLRARLDRVLAVLDRHDIDVLALQETKCADTQFPEAPFHDAGYQVAHTGLNQWNGVAIVSRVGIDDVEIAFPGQPGFAKPLPATGRAAGRENTPGEIAAALTSSAPSTSSVDTEPAATLDLDLSPAAALEARALGATCGGVRVWSLYVPHGRALDDPHYEYKLSWLTALNTAASAWLAEDDRARIALVGDWNVIPLDTDLYDPAVFTGHTHVTPAERDAFAAFEQSGYVEVTREFIPAQHTYTYWDYKQLAFPRNNGLRLDFAYFSPELAKAASHVVIDRNERKGKGASDHVPVIIDVTS